MAQQPSFGSNNPFRRKAPPAPPRLGPSFADPEASTPTPETATALSPGNQFWSQLQAHAHPNQPAPATSFQKPKVLKKVRVQSPPPSPPESAGAPDRLPLVDDDDDGQSSSSVDTDEQVDPFTHASSTGSADESDREDEPQPTPSNRAPPNPFQKTLRDLEIGPSETTQSSSSAPGTRNTLDVDAFRRLLLTGQAPPLSHPAAPGGDGASTTDTSSISRQSISDTIQPAQETPRTSHEVSELEAEDDRRRLISSPRSSLQPAPTILRKKPPPPSSRHGKLIKAGIKAEGEAGAGLLVSSPTRGSTTLRLTSPSKQRPPTPSDVNKPLPPAPQRLPTEEDIESVFDREAAGKVPELDVELGTGIISTPRPPTPPNTSRAASNVPSKKPAPPPRRQPHGRSESKATATPPLVPQDDSDPSLRRSSVDSTRSRSSSLRVSVHAPAPPPPRRPGHAPRASSTFNSPLPAGVTSPGGEKSPSDVNVVAPTTEQAPSPLSTPGQQVAMTSSPPPMGDTSTSSSSNSNNHTPGTATPAPAPASTSTAEPVTAGVMPTPSPSSSENHFAQVQARLHAKISPPPPPPARNASVRAKRPISAGGTTPSPLGPGPPLASRRGSGRGKDGAVAPSMGPPPPPRRDRGGSGSSMQRSVDGSAPASTPHGSGLGSTNETGNVSSGAIPVSLAEGVVNEDASMPTPASATGDILADLGRLQMEVDALRGKYEMEKEKGAQE
ncbi:hypothetical protein MMYC01_203833 [Madurella mycetomatis]|uniref:Uncharacterized protein n=1 Tax=Madurella mycetomatis TaxID=100816 RepID=A0A175WAF4_9PEZI|nr:hypothetical protein MMYC01_203833 [Madurella mycetomatis]